jgi:glycosyltransferase involved in cell wall biosynthesis
VKIVHIEAGRHLYGGAQQVAYLVDALAERGISNVVVCPRGAAIAGRVAASAEVVEAPFGGDLDFTLPARLRSVLAKVDPDLVHVHSRRGADLYAGLAAGGHWPAVLTRRVDSAEWAPWARFKYTRYARVVAISRAVERALLAAGLPRERVQLVPSGVDAERYRPDPGARTRLLAAFSLPEDAFVAGVVAQLIPRKGHRELLDWIPSLAARHPRLVVLCFGRGPLAERIEREIAARGVERHVVLAGFRDDLPTLLPGLDALLHPATAEGLGVAVLEALACGVPVVASAVGGLVDVIEPGVHGLLVPCGAHGVPAPRGVEGPRGPRGMQRPSVPPGERGAWIEALELLMTDPAARERFAAAGRRRVEEAFSAERMAEGTLAVYEAVLHGGAVRRRALA